jgi:hypothetical protein
VADEPTDVAQVIQFPRPKFGQDDQDLPTMTYEEGLAFCLAYAEAEAALPPW